MFLQINSIKHWITYFVFIEFIFYLQIWKLFGRQFLDSKSNKYYGTELVLVLLDFMAYQPQ